MINSLKQLYYATSSNFNKNTYLNLNDHVIQGGRASTVKGGINWYPNSHVRVMANYIHALDISSINAQSVTGTLNATSRAFNKADLDMIETRVQLDW